MNSPKFIGIDLASESDIIILHLKHGGRGLGKSLAVKNYINDYVKKHSKTVIIYSDGRIEKPVKGKHVLK